MDLSKLGAQSVPLISITAQTKTVKGTKITVANVPGVKPLLLPYDPLSLDSVYSSCIKQQVSVGGKEEKSTFRASPASELSITFLLDDTVYPNLVAFFMPKMGDTVDSLIKSMIKLWHTPNKKAKPEQPNFVLLKPFDMPLLNSPAGGFFGQLSKMTIKNEIISSAGKRLKARVECVFVESQKK